MTFDDAKAKFQEITGDAPERPVEQHESGYRFGDRVRISETDEDRGLYANDEGMLILEMVGSSELGNERLSMSVLVDDEDSPRDVTVYDIEPV